MSTSCLKVATLHQYLQDIRVSCKDGLDFHEKKVETSVVSRRRDFNYLHTSTQFCKETLGGRRGEEGLDVLKTCGKSSCSLRKRTLKQPQVTRYMKVIISHFNTIAIATPLMKRVHEKQSSTFIRHAGEFLHMDHYEFTHVFILFIKLLVIELFYGRSLSSA